MSLEIIKTLQSELAEMKVELGKVRADAVAESKAFAEELAANLKETRKTTFEDAQIDTKALKAKASDLSLKAQLSGKSMKDFAEYKDLASMVEKSIKPADVANWIQNSFSSGLMEALRLDLKVEALFSTFQIPAGVQALQVPAKTSNTVAYLTQPATNAIESAMTAGKISFTAKKLKTLVTIADETANESIITAIMDVVRADMISTLAQASENTIVNGNTDITVAGGSINGEITATDVKAAFDGLRKAGMSNTTDFGAGADSTLLAKFRAMRKSMGVYGVNVSDLALIVSPTIMYRMLNIPEVLTMDKIGTRATILNGQIASLDGIPVIVSEALTSTLLATGKEGGALTGALLVNKRWFATATRGGGAAEVELDRNIINGTDIIVASRYLDFKKLFDAAVPVSYGINIAL